MSEYLTNIHQIRENVEFRIKYQ